MRNHALLLGSVATLALFSAGAAMAEDFGWNGAFVGADVGLGIGSHQRTSFSFGEPIDDGAMGSEALTGGLYAGYDVEVAPGMVFGIEAGVDFFNSEGSRTQETLLDQYEFRSLGAAYAAVRAGVEVAPRTLAYASAGYAAIHAQSSEDLVPSPNQEFLDGYRVAVGLETEVIDNVTLRVQGTYTAAVEPLVSGDADEYESTPSHLGASVGVSYRFGGPSRGPRIDLQPQRSWSGGYVGVLAGGYSTSSVNGGLASIGNEGPASTIVGQYGAYMGVNLQVGDQIVIGAEGDFSIYDATYDAIHVDTYDFASSDHKAQVSVRLGYLVNPDTLLYARAGYGLMHINPDSFYSEPGTEAAYVQTASAGIGVETMVSPNALLRLEGLYTTALEEYRFNDNTSTGGYYVKPSSVEARVGAAFMF